MKSFFTTTLGAAAVALATSLLVAPAHAADAEALAKDAGCLKCHTVDKKKKGPALKAVAADYKKLGADKAVAKMKEAHEADDLKGVKSEADLKAIANWIGGL